MGRLTVVFAFFAVIALQLASAGKASHCCATSESWSECRFQTQAIGDHGCFDITYTDDDNAASWTDFEFVASVEFNKAYTGFVTTTKGKFFSFSLAIPAQWDRRNWQFQGNDGKFFEAILGRHIVGLTMSAEASKSVIDVLTDPQPVQVMRCDDGLHMTCGLDPMFSMLDYKVSGSTKPECFSKGSWEESRSSFTINMDVCPTTIDNGNASYLSKTVVLEPEDETWYLNRGKHASIPNKVVCTCIYKPQGEAWVLLDENFTTSKVLWQEAEGEILNMSVKRKLVKQDLFLVTLKLATNLSKVLVETCTADAIGSNGFRLHQKFHLMHNYATADTFPRSTFRGFTEKEYNLLKQIEVKTRRGYQHQVVEFFGFTAGETSIFFTCSAWVCLEDEDKDTDDSAIAAQVGAPDGVQRCLKRRLSTAEFLSPAQRMPEGFVRRLDTPQEAQSQRVALSDSDCFGFVMPGATGCPHNGTFVSIEFKFDALDYYKLTATVKGNLEKTLKEHFASTSGVNQDLIHVELSAGSVKVAVTMAGAKPDVSIPTVEELTDAVKLVPDIDAVIAEGYSIDKVVASEPKAVQRGSTFVDAPPAVAAGGSSEADEKTPPAVAAGGSSEADEKTDSCNPRKGVLLMPLMVLFRLM